MDMTLFLGQAGWVLMLGLAAIGSSLGIGAAGRAAAGAWAKEAKAGKPLSFTYIVLTGMPLSQTLYAFLLLFLLQEKVVGTESAVVSQYAGVIFGIGLGCGLLELFSAWLQGMIGAAACRALSEGEGKGFVNMIIAMGIVESVGLLGMIFLLLSVLKIQVPA